MLIVAGLIMTGIGITMILGVLISVAMFLNCAESSKPITLDEIEQVLNVRL